MNLTVKQIIENSNDTEEIKGVEEQFAVIQQVLEVAFQSQDAPVPEEGMRELLSAYEIYLHIESVSNPLERHKSLEELERRLEALKIRFKEFAPKEAIDGIETLQLWAKISKTMMEAKTYTLAASAEDKDEVKQLGFFYAGLIKSLEIAENYLDFFTEKGRKLTKALAETVINYKTFEDYAKKRPEDKLTSQARGIRDVAKLILWEIDRHEKKKLSYKALYEEAKNAVETENKEELIAMLRSWREEDINELHKLSKN
jgi:hypothetical protein